jgi:TonB-dependent receptor
MKSRLFATTSMKRWSLPVPIALALCATAVPLVPVRAQTSQPAQTAIEEVVVTGQRLSQRKSVDRQRDSDTFVSALSADDVGNFPDQNVAEATRRLPGISVENDQGEGRFVVLRGFDANLNSTSINGLAVPSPQREGGRAVALDTIPSELLSGLVISKTFRPDLDGDAIGGVIEIETGSAFDRDEAWFTARAEGSHGTLEKKESPRLSLAGASRFGNDRFGVAAALSWYDRKFGSEGNEVDVGWQTTGGATYPIEVEQRNYIIARERIGAVLNLDLAASDSTTFFLRSLYSDYSDLEFRNRHEYLVRAAAPSAATATSVRFNDRIRIDRESKDRTQAQKITSLQFGGKTETGDWRLDGVAGYSRAEEDELNRLDSTFRREFRSSAVPGFLFEYDYSDPRRIKLAGVNAATQIAVTDPAQFPLTALDLSNNTVRDKELSARFDARRDMTDGFVKFGGKLRLRDREDDLNRSSLLTAAIPAGTLATAFRRDVEYTLVPNFGPAIDPAAVRAFADQRRGSFVVNAFDSFSGDYQSSEDVYAGYAMGQVEMDALTWLGGVRIEHTKFETTGVRFTGVATPINAMKDYTSILPSLNVKFEPADQWVLRGAVTRSISRTLPDASAARFAVDDDEVSVGNPDLKPFRSWNFDAIAEYYPSDSNVVSLGVFHKRVADYIVFRDVAGQPGFTGFTSAIRPENGDTAKVTGIEANIQQSLDFLPAPLDGLLISANYSYIDGEVRDGTGREIPLPKQSKNIANVALGFEKWGLSLRAALAYRSKYLDIIDNLGYDDRFVRGHMQIDLSAKYNLNEQMQVYAEATNINDRPFVATFTNPSQLNHFERYGATYALGVRYTY